jgi:hypothetical protein
MKRQRGFLDISLLYSDGVMVVGLFMLKALQNRMHQLPRKPQNRANADDAEKYDCQCAK